MRRVRVRVRVHVAPSVCRCTYQWMPRLLVLRSSICTAFFRLFASIMRRSAACALYCKDTTYRHVHIKKIRKLKRERYLANQKRF
jgi:hypothetical protein